MEWFSEHAWQAWLGLAIVLGAAEMLTLDLLLLMFAVGAVVGMVAALLGAAVWLQALVAIGTAGATLALVRPALLKRLHNGPELQQGHTKLIGEQGMVTRAISGSESGQVKINGEVWTARPYDPTLVIEAGEQVEIFEIRGATAFVHPIASLPPS